MTENPKSKKISKSFRKLKNKIEAKINITHAEQNHPRTLLTFLSGKRYLFTKLQTMGFLNTEFKYFFTQRLHNEANCILRISHFCNEILYFGNIKCRIDLMLTVFVEAYVIK